MLLLQGNAALSPFRTAKLVAESPVPPSALTATHLYVAWFAAAAAPGDAERARLRDLLGGGDWLEAGPLPAGAFVVTPRVGTLSPWASKARDICINCGLTDLERVERVTLWQVAGVDADALAALAARVHDRMTETVLWALEDLARLHHPTAPAPLGHVVLGDDGGAALTAANARLGGANLEQAHAWIRPHMTDGGELIVTALPLYHIFSLTANCLTFFKIGAENVLITNPRDIPAFVKELGKHRFTAITGVNTLFNALLNHPDFAALDFSSLRISLGGGMAVQRAVAEKWRAVTGHTLVEAYGLTETSPAACINPLDLIEFNHSIGLPISSTEISIRDDDGNELEIGQPGELCIRGPQVMKGYWNRPEDTRRAIMADGFLRTGDVATVDDAGFVRIVDRKKDMILVSGFNVYPNEVEDVIAAHPEVLEVAAVGVPDERSGEAVKVFVVRKGASLTREALIAHCRESLTGYKVPHLVEFRDELPKTNVGKILRRKLREPNPSGDA